MLSESNPIAWRVGRREELTLDQPRLMGILNVTPDSFSDGGAYSSIEEAVAAALRMKVEGACIIDVGGESTRPGAKAITASEQIDRTIPVIQALRQEVTRDELLISIDTTRSEVAAAALETGADIINDISAGRDDEGMFALAVTRDCGLIIMHRLKSPHRDSYCDQYDTSPNYGGDVVGFIRKFLSERAEAAVASGVNPTSIVIDPGLGFGKSVEQNYELIGSIGEICELGYPVLSAASRKSFLGAVTDVENPAHRVYGSVAVSIAHWLAGVRLFRVHDVKAHYQALAVAASSVGKNRCTAANI